MTDRPNAFPRAAELALYAISPLATLATAPILAHSLGPIGRGQYGVAMAVAAFTITLGSWGQGEVHLARTREGRNHYPDHSRITILSGLLAGVATFAALLLLGLPIGLAVATAIWVPVLSQVSLWRAASIATHRLKPPALDSAIGPLLRLAVLIVLALLAALTAETATFGVQAALAVGSVATVAIAARGLRRSVPQSPPGKVRDDVMRGGAVIVFNVLHAVALRADIIVLQLLSTPFQVGIYSAPASLTTSALALSSAYRPRVQSAALSAEPLRRIVREVLQVVALGAAATTVLWFAVPILVPILFGEAFEDAEPLMRLLVLAIVPLLTLDLAFGALVVLSRRRDLLTTAGLAAGVTMGALLAMTPGLGATGAALACIAGNLAGSIVGWFLLVRTLRSMPPLPPSDKP